MFPTRQGSNTSSYPSGGHIKQAVPRSISKDCPLEMCCLDLSPPDKDLAVQVDNSLADKEGVVVVFRVP